MPSENEIERRAYQLYEERGKVEGHAQDDWLQAEHELRARKTAAEQSGATENPRASDPPRRRRKDAINSTAPL
jgi:hypothetical protein